MMPLTALLTHAASLRAQAQTLCAQADALEQLAALPLPAAPQAPASPYLSIAQLCAKHPAFCVRTVRAWVTARGVNGLHSAVVELGTKGGKLLIDEQAFLRWVGQHKPSVAPITTHQRRRP